MGLITSVCGKKYQLGASTKTEYYIYIIFVTDLPVSNTVGYICIQLYIERTPGFNKLR